jgi:hypothetical protein
MPVAGSASPSRLFVSTISQAENGLQTLPACPKAALGLSFSGGLACTARRVLGPSELPLSALNQFRDPRKDEVKPQRWLAVPRYRRV